MADRIYCYPDSDVLMNKLNIRDMDKLQNFERRLTMLRLSELLDRPVAGKFDLEHLQRIHRYIFQDVYEWAGQIRMVDIAKENMFCNMKFIEPQARTVGFIIPYQGEGRVQKITEPEQESGLLWFRCFIRKYTKA